MSPSDRPIALLRAATRSDAIAIGELGGVLVRLHHEFDPARFIPPTEETARGYGEYVRRQVGKPNVVVVVAERDGVVVGYAWGSADGYDYMSLRGPAGVIIDIVVDAAHRGQGVGRMLLEGLTDRLAALGARQFVLSTAARNAPAQQLFERAGFRRTMIEMTRDLDAKTDH